ncbi:acetyl-CoA carboxylase [Limosilactobacillus sp.]|uniref:acetyl-CoA carboxylase n=1 Tax=Limosilactobacillus sp. TaxID=2773925 RepID=UPI00345ECBCB
MNTKNVEALIKLLKDNNLAELEYSNKNEHIKLKALNPLAQATPAQPSTTASADAKQAVMAPKATATNNNTINAPSVGVFYTAKSPQEPPYVKVGDHVKKGDVVGIIEVMKAFTDVVANREGTVEKVLVNNEEGVEYGQPLIQLK